MSVTRTFPKLLIALWSLFVLVGPASPSAAQRTKLIDFDELSAPAPIGDAYRSQGVMFLVGNAQYGNSTVAGDSAWTFQAFAISPPNIMVPNPGTNSDIWVFFYDACGARAFATFASIRNDEEASPPEIILEAFDEHGTSIASSVGAGAGGTAAIDARRIWCLKIYSQPGAAGYLGVDNFRFTLEGSTNTIVSASIDATAYPVYGCLPEQLAELNAGPPPFDPETWLPVESKNENGGGEGFCCSCEGVSDPQCESDWLSSDLLAEPFVSALEFIEEADEVTYDNCGSAFYRFTFDLPPNYIDACLMGLANVDDQGVAFLNGHQITGTMHTGFKNCDPAPCEPCYVGPDDPDCVGCDPDPAEGPYDLCYRWQDSAPENGDMFDDEGRQILTWPTRDPFGACDPDFFVSGENELVFAVAGDASFFEPTGVEFEATVSYDLLGDGDSDGDVDLRDVAGFQRCFTDPVPGELNAGCSRYDFDGDDDVDLDDHTAFVQPGVFTGAR